MNKRGGLYVSKIAVRPLALISGVEGAQQLETIDTRLETSSLQMIAQILEGASHGRLLDPKFCHGFGDYGVKRTSPSLANPIFYKKADRHFAIMPFPSIGHPSFAPSPADCYNSISATVLSAFDRIRNLFSQSWVDIVASAQVGSERR